MPADRKQLLIVMSPEISCSIAETLAHVLCSADAWGCIVPGNSELKSPDQYFSTICLLVCSALNLKAEDWNAASVPH